MKDKFPISRIWSEENCELVRVNCKAFADANGISKYTQFIIGIIEPVHEENKAFFHDLKDKEPLFTVDEVTWHIDKKYIKQWNKEMAEEYAKAKN